MSSMIRSRMLGASLHRSCLQTRSQLLPAQTRLAHQDYGSGKGNPVGENPEKQGPNPSADKEHPGPPPPKAGQGSGSSPTKGTAEGHNSSKSGSGSSSQKRQFSTMRTMQAEKRPKSTEGLEPKILNESSPKEDANSDVKQHNKEFAERADRAHEAYGEKDKVSSKFWSEEKDDKTGGRDKSNS